MGTLKVDADRVNKRLMKTRLEALEKKVKLLETVTANLVRDVATSESVKQLMAQPDAHLESTNCGEP